jgi:hypothetical protein
MANAWAFSAFLWVGLAFIVKRSAMGFRASTALRETARPTPAHGGSSALFQASESCKQQRAKSVFPSTQISHRNRRTTLDDTQLRIRALSGRSSLA